MRSVLCLFLLAGCALPDLGLPADSAASRGAYPELLPLKQVFDRTDAPDRITAPATGSLAERAARLRARAAAMRASALGDAERTRIRDAAARLSPGEGGATPP